MSRRASALLGALVIALAVLSPVAASAVSTSTGDQLELTEASATPVVENRFKGETAGYWIVTLEDSAVATYEGGTSGLAATSATATGAAKLDASSPEAQAYSSYLSDMQADLLVRMTERFSRTIDVRHQYTNAINGLSVYLTPDEANVVLKMNGVMDVDRVRVNVITSDSGPTWIGAPNVWDGSATGLATQGEGVIVGIIDTGINPSNPSFAAVGGDGYVHVNPFGAGNYVGACDPLNTDQFFAAFTCNSKLIGAYDFLVGDDVVDGGVNPLDHDGHGSHTASTAAGNVVNTTGPTGDPLTISGVAPHANIISYRVCGDELAGFAGCPSDASVAAVDAAIGDGVDVLNFSIGSGSPGDPWTDADDQAFLAARSSGILVAHSAGNEGPGAATVGSPAGPWVMHVAATTHNRTFLNSLISMTGGDTAPPPDLQGRGATAGYGPARIVYAGDLPADILAMEGAVNNALCAVGDPNNGIDESPWGASVIFSGEIVVCDRGTYPRVEKSSNAAAAGALGFVMADNGGGVAADQHVIPGVHISQTDGQLVKDWIATGTGHEATITPGVFTLDDALGDAVAGFSSRGPNRSTGGDTLMPTVGAPGVDIWAADGKYDAITYGFKSGTSMASPHAAGAAALLIALHPDWTPAEVQSALATTSLYSGPVKGDGVTPADPFDVGSGRIRVDVAAAAGLVFDESEADYVAADPTAGGDPTQVNLASIANGQCVQVCEFHRTVKSSAAGSVTWNSSTSGAMTTTVDPASFTLAPGATQDLHITVDVSDGSVPSDVYTFGHIVLTPNDVSVPEAQLPIAVQKKTGDIPAGVAMETRRDAGSWLISGLTAIEITEFTGSVNGLVKATFTDMSLGEDATNGNPYDNQNDGTVQTEILTVAPGTTHLIAEIVASESPDLDLWVGFDTNGDGLGSSDEQIAFSASGTAFESVVIDNPAAGDWWVLVQNWAASASPPDALTLATALLDGSNTGNAWVAGPATQPQLEQFDVRFGFDVPGSEPGDLYYGEVSLGTDAGNPGNIGSFPVTLNRLEDDVRKDAAPTAGGWGDTIDYTITVDSNVNPEDFEYHVMDVIPAGMTYVPDSLSATAGDAWEDGGVIHWLGTQITPFGVEGTYNVTTNATDPGCAVPLSDGYLNLADFGIGPSAAISGDTVAFGAFGGLDPFEFYDDPSAGMNFTDDGFVFFDSNPGPEPWQPHNIPDDLAPNDMAAVHWTDMEIVYDAVAGSGVSLGALGTAGAIIEYDDMQPWPAGETDARLDFEIFMWGSIDNSPGAWEIAYAYANVTGDWSGIPGVVGVENELGTAGVEFFAGDVSTAGLEGLVVCFDYEGPAIDPIEITYQVTIDGFASGELVNNVTSTVDNPGSAEDTTSATVLTGAELTSPNAKIQAVADAVAALEETGNRWTDLQIRKANEELARALSEGLWVDGDTLHPTFGRQVFDALARAVKNLNMVSRLTGMDVGLWTDTMLDAARELAVAAIDDAVAAGADPKEIAKAWTEISNGDERRIRGIGNAHNAIKKYKKAWDKATKAMKKALA